MFAVSVCMLAVAVAAGVAISPPFVGQTLDELIRAAADTCEALPLDSLFALPLVPELNVVEFTKDGHRSYTLAKAHKILRDRLPDKLNIYIPGWMNSPTDEASQTLAKAILNKSSLVLIIDTRASFYRGYISSAARVTGVSQSLFKFINKLQMNGYDLSSIHLIGFSLGAHVAAMTGKLVQSRLNDKIERITALDPARPCFMRPSQYRLDKRDATFVQVIHTSAGFVGLEQAVGHADLYVNGVLEPQPECKEQPIRLECEHALAWKLFSASVTDERSLVGRKCNDWLDLRSGGCNGNETVMGYECGPGTRGIFLHRTQEVAKQLRVFNPFDWQSWLGR